MKIAIVGIGYVGLSNAIVLSQNHSVILLDVDQSKVDLINSNQSPFIEEMVADYLANKELDISATVNSIEAFTNADFIVIAAPTNFDSETKKFDTSIVDAVIKEAYSINPIATIIIKSTVPLGYTDKISSELLTKNIIFSPEFLREGRSLEDNLHPSRIVLGQSSRRAQKFAEMLQQGALKKDIEVIFTQNEEAESIKLFSNAYLAMRVAFFNELDSYALEHNLDARSIINGVSADSRIGKFYNNPSFGYGGYCLPKDTKQVLSNFNDTPQNLIKAIVESNKTRINFIAQKIIELAPLKVGIYRLIMKANSDNWRESSLIHLIKKLMQSQIKIVVYEPLMSTLDMDSVVEFVDTLESLNKEADLILTNRMDEKILKYESKIFTRDLYGNN